MEFYYVGCWGLFLLVMGDFDIDIGVSYWCDFVWYDFVFRF